MTYDYDSLPPNCLAKIREVSKLKQDVDEREDECIFWHRQFEDAKEMRSMDSEKHGSVDVVVKKKEVERYERRI